MRRDGIAVEGRARIHDFSVAADRGEQHGIGHGKMDYLAESLGPVQMRIMEGVKEVFDPNMILNPGKICYKL